jgi:hypothetical protein
LDFGLLLQRQQLGQLAQLTQLFLTAKWLLAQPAVLMATAQPVVSD